MEFGYQHTKTSVKKMFTCVSKGIAAVIFQAARKDSVYIVLQKIDVMCIKNKKKLTLISVKGTFQSRLKTNSPRIYTNQALGAN